MKLLFLFGFVNVIATGFITNRIISKLIKVKTACSKETLLAKSNSDYGEPSRFSELSLFTESLVFNQTLQTFFKYLEDYKDDASKSWLNSFVNKYSNINKIKWSGFLEAMATCEPEVILSRESPTATYFKQINNAGADGIIKHSRLVEPRALAYRLLVTRDNLLRELYEDVIKDNNSEDNTKGDGFSSKYSQTTRDESLKVTSTSPDTPFREMNAILLSLELWRVCVEEAIQQLRATSRTAESRDGIRLLTAQVELQQQLHTEVKLCLSSYNGRKRDQRVTNDSGMSPITAITYWKNLLAPPSSSITERIQSLPQDLLHSNVFIEEYSTSDFSPTLQNLSPAILQLLSMIAKSHQENSALALQLMSADSPRYFEMIERNGGSSLSPAPALAKTPIADNQMNQFVLEISPELAAKYGISPSGGSPRVSTVSSSSTGLSGELPIKGSGSDKEGVPSDDSSTTIPTTDSTIDFKLIDNSKTSSINDSSNNSSSSSSPSLTTNPVISGTTNRNERIDPNPPSLFVNRKGWQTYGSSKDPEGYQEPKPATDGERKKSIALLDPPSFLPPTDPPPSIPDTIPPHLIDEEDNSNPIEFGDIERGSVEDLFRILGRNIRIRVVSTLKEQRELNAEPNKNSATANIHDPDFLCLEGIGKVGKLRLWVKYQEAVHLLNGDIDITTSTPGSTTTTTSNNNSNEEEEGGGGDSGPFFGGGVVMM